MQPFRFTAFLYCLAIMLLVATPQGIARAEVSDGDKAQAIVHVLDYVGVDYPESVQNGQVIKQEEYAEQRDFAAQALTLLGQLSPVSEQEVLVQQARELLAHIEAKASGTVISTLANQLLVRVIEAWKLSVAPRQAPDPQRGETLFVQHCAACHGTQEGRWAIGQGNGPSSP